MASLTHLPPRALGVGLLIAGTALAAAPPPPPQPLVAAFFPEGPCVIGKRLFYVDYAAHTVMAWDGKDAKRVWHKDGSGPAAIIPWKEGSLLVTCYDGNAVARIDPTGKKKFRPIEPPLGATFVGPNDFAADGQGGVYLSTSGKWEKDAKPEGKVFYISAAGKVSKVADDGLHYANGMAVVDGGKRLGKRLLVAEGLAGRIRQYPIKAAGVLGKGSDWKYLDDIRPRPKDADWSTGPDGLKADAKGNVYICQFGAGRVLVTKPDGAWLRTITLPLKGVTNVAISPGGDVLYVTAVTGANGPHLGAVYEAANR